MKKSANNVNQCLCHFVRKTWTVKLKLCAVIYCDSFCSLGVWPVCSRPVSTVCRSGRAPTPGGPSIHSSTSAENLEISTSIASTIFLIMQFVSVNVETLSGEFWETAPPNLYFVSHVRGLECPDVRWSLAASQDCQRPVGLGPARVGYSVGGSLDSVMINSSAVLCCLVWYAKKRVKSDDIQ